MDATQIEADVERRLGWSPFRVGTGPSASIEALVTRNAAVWTAFIRMRRADGTELGTREVTSDSKTCDSLAKAGGLAIALMIKTAYLDLSGAPPAPASEGAAPALGAASSVPGASTSSSATSLSSTSTPNSTSLLTAGPSEAPIPPVREEHLGSVLPAAVDAAGEGTNERPGFGLAGGIVCAAKVLPGVACGPALRTELHLHRHWAASITVSMLPERTITRSGARVGFDLTSAMLSGCYGLVTTGTWSVSTCTSLLVGALHVTVAAPTPVGAGQRSWWAASLGLRSAWQLGVLEVQGGAEALALLSRHDYTLERVSPSGSTASLFEQAPVGLLGMLAVGVRF